jgi:hypothetical protein
LEQYPKPPLQALPVFWCGRPEVLSLDQHLAARRGLQADQMPQQGALAAAAATHDDEDIAAPDGEGEIALDHEVAVRHGQTPDLDVCRFR